MGRGLQDPRPSARRWHAGDQLLRAAHERHRRAHRAGLRDRPCGILVCQREVLRLHQAAGEEGLHRLDHRRARHQELQLLVQRVLELLRGEGLREPVRHDERQPDVLQLHLAGDDLRNKLQQLRPLGLARVYRLHQARRRDGRIRAIPDQRRERVQAGAPAEC